MKIQGKGNQQGVLLTGDMQQGNQTQGTSAVSSVGTGAVQGRVDDIGAQFFPGITDRPPHGNTFGGPEPTQFPGITDKPPHTTLPVVPGWQDGVAFDQLVDKLLGGNTSARPHEAQQIADFLSTIPTSEDLVHAMRGLEKLSANNYFKGETIDTVNNAVYDRLTAFDPPVWGDAAAFERLVEKLFSSNTSARPQEAEQMGAFLNSITDTDQLIHAARAIKKLEANNYFTGEAKEIINDALYQNLAQFDRPTFNPLQLAGN